MSKNNVVFIISLPRSGSTMLQHILGSHSEMIATAEPWILFPQALSLKKGAIQSSYDHEICRIAITDFLDQLENKEQEYYTAVRKMASHLYETFLKENNKTFFIDKTSRYYQALPEIFKIFPDAKFVFLVRNPLGTFSSFITTMVRGNLSVLGENGIRNDLMNGYKQLVSAYAEHQEKCHFVKYEDIVLNPYQEIQKLCNYIGVEFQEEMIQYQSKIGVLKGKLVDPKSIHKHEKPVTDYLTAWKDKLDTTQKKILALGFVNHLGKELIEQIGYNYEELLSFFKDIESKHLSSSRYMKWNDLLTAPAHRTLQQQNRLYYALCRQKKGVGGMFRYYIKFPLYLLRLLKVKIQRNEA